MKRIGLAAVAAVLVACIARDAGAQGGVQRDAQGFVGMTEAATGAIQLTSGGSA